MVSSILHRPAVTSHIFKFVTNTVKRAVELAHVCCDFRDAVVNYSPALWCNIFRSDKRAVTRCIHQHETLTFPMIAVAKHGGDAVLVEILSSAKSAVNHELTLELLRQFAERVSRLPLPQLLAAIDIADLCAWLLNEARPISNFDAKYIVAALLRRSPPLLEFARRVAALPAPATGLASSGWSFFVAVFLVASALSLIDDAVHWLQYFPHRFSVTHPEAREWFGQLMRTYIEQEQDEQRAEDLFLKELAPALLRIVHDTRNSEGKQDEEQQQQVITSASNAASLLFSVGVAEFAVDLSGCVLEDCNLVATDFTKVSFKSSEHGELQMKECVVEDIVGLDVARDQARLQLLEKGKRCDLVNAIKAHHGVVHDVCFSPDGMTFVTGSADNTVKVWDFVSGTCLKTLRGQSEGVLRVAVSPADGNVIASLNTDRTVTTWDKTTGQLINNLSERAVFVVFSPDGKVMANAGHDDARTIHLWDMSTGYCFRILSGHTGRVESVAFSADGKSIISGSWDYTVKIWDVTTGECLRTLSGHTEAIYTVAVSPNGSLVVSGGNDSALRLWDAASGTCVRSLRGHREWVHSAAFSPDGTIIASGSADASVRLWNTKTGLCIRTLMWHTDFVAKVAFSPDGKSILSSAWDKHVCFWDVTVALCILAVHMFDKVVRI